MGRSAHSRGKQRGRGGAGGSRGRNRGGRGRGRGGAPAQLPVPVGDALLVTLDGSEEFMAMLNAEDCPLVAITGKEDGSEVHYRLPAWFDLSALLKWFSKATAVDPNASISFSTLLNKDHRASVHAQASNEHLHALEAVSQGVGAKRYSTVVRSDNPLAVKKNEPKDSKLLRQAALLRQWASDEVGVSLSCDEAAEMFEGDGKLSPQLDEIWKRKWPLQELAQQVCQALDTQDNDTLRNALKAAPQHFIQEGFMDELRSQDGLFGMDTWRGSSPLHIAAVNGLTEALEMLLEAGFPVNYKDGTQRTALELCRRAEQCDAEGVLLRAGAHDANAETLPAVQAKAEHKEPKKKQEEDVKVTGSEVVGENLQPRVNVDGHATRATESESAAAAEEAVDGATTYATAPSSEADSDIGHASLLSMCGTERSLAARNADVDGMSAAQSEVGGYGELQSPRSPARNGGEGSLGGNEKEQEAAVTVPAVDKEEEGKEDTIANASAQAATTAVGVADKEAAVAAREEAPQEVIEEEAPAVAEQQTEIEIVPRRELTAANGDASDAKLTNGNHRNHNHTDRSAAAKEPPSAVSSTAKSWADEVEEWTTWATEWSKRNAGAIAVGLAVVTAGVLVWRSTKCRQAI